MLMWLMMIEMVRSGDIDVQYDDCVEHPLEPEVKT